MLGRRLSPGVQGQASFTPATTRRRCPTKVRPKARRESLGHGRSSKARACTPLARWSHPGCERCLSGWPRPLRALASAWSAIYIERRLQALLRRLPVDPTALADVWKFLVAGDGVGAIDTIGLRHQYRLRELLLASAKTADSLRRATERGESVDRRAVQPRTRQ